MNEHLPRHDDHDDLHDLHKHVPEDRWAETGHNKVRCRLRHSFTPESSPDTAKNSVLAVFCPRGASCVSGPALRGRVVLGCYQGHLGSCRRHEHWRLSLRRALDVPPAPVRSPVATASVWSGMFTTRLTLMNLNGWEGERPQWTHPFLPPCCCCCCFRLYVEVHVCMYVCMSTKCPE